MRTGWQRMCFQGNCFEFENFRDQKVAIFISGPGHLEYPWALETALQLAKHGAIVQVFDISDFSLKYSARIRFKKFVLPYQSRKFLRKIFLSAESRIENLFAQICKSNQIKYLYVHSCTPVSYSATNKKLPISYFSEKYWGQVPIENIIRTVLSGRIRKLAKNDDFVDLHTVQEIEAAIEETNQFLESLNNDGFDAFFLANGRQPIQATLTINLRKKGKNVTLYENGGGAIFSDFLSPHIDYWETSPANIDETRSKILCQNFNTCKSPQKLSMLLDSVKERKKIPFTIDYLTTDSTMFDEEILGKGNNYAFFTTTDWEFSILYNRNMAPDTFRSQIEAVDFLVDNLGEEDKLFIRMHPSDPAIDSIFEPDWEKYLSSDKIFLIYPNSRLNSFDLASHMNINFVWSSFIGFELILRNHKVGVFGDAAYGDLLGENWITTPKKAQRFLSEPKNVNPKSVLPYANYLASGGFEMTSSEVKLGREIFLLGERADKLRFFFRWMPKRILVKIS